MKFESSVPSLAVLEEFVRAARQIYMICHPADLTGAYIEARRKKKRNLREKIFQRMIVDVMEECIQARGLVVNK